VAQAAEHRRNWLLRALEPEEFDDRKPDLEIVHLPKGTVLYEAGDPIHSIYFTHNAVVGLITIMEDGRGDVLRARGLMRPAQCLEIPPRLRALQGAGPRHCIKDRLEQDP